MTTAEIIRKLAGRDQSAFLYVCTVVSVNGATCTCSPINGDADIEDVRLQAASTTNGMLITPVIGSFVVVSMLNDTEGVVVMFSEIENIKFFDGSSGEFVLIGPLVQRLNAIEQDINNLKQVFSSWTPVSNDGGAALKTAAAAWFSSDLDETEADDIKNPKISQ